jgi:hypothetical protein
MQKVKARTEKALEGQSVNCLPLETLRAIKGVEELIHGDEVNIGLASRYWKKHWDIFSRIDAVQSKKISEGRYRLSNQLLQATGRQLLKLRRNEKAWPSDTLAVALCWAAQEVGPPSQEPDDDSDYWLENQPIWEIEHPISEAWTDLGKLPVPWDLEGSLRLDSHTKEWVKGPARQGKEDADEVQERMRAIAKTGGNGLFKSPPPARSDQTDRFVVCISRTFEKCRTELPKLTIEVEGVPVCDLMKAFQSNSKPTGEGFEGAEKLRDAILEWVSESIGQSKPGPGAKSKGKGPLAAFLFYHKGFSWPRVARELCTVDHLHNAHCTDNFRKQSAKYS